MLKNIIRHCYHFGLYVAAFVVLTSAIAITVIRLALPGIGEYRQQTQDWISQTMNYPVKISNIEASWESWTPVLRLNQVSILDPVSNEHILNFNSVFISINIFKSLMRNEITPGSITVSDLDLTLIRQQDGSLIVSRYLADASHLNESDNDSLAKWFLSQNNISVKKAHITLFDLNKIDEEPIHLSDATLHMRNNDFRTQIEGTVTLPEAYGHTLNFALDANGNMLSSDWSGEIYLEGENINISPLLETMEISEGLSAIEQHDGTANIKLWSTWNQAKIRQLEGQLKLNDVTLVNNQTSLNINKLAASFLARRRTDKGVDLAVDLEELVTSNGNWPKSSLSLNKIFDDKNHDYRYTAKTSFLNLDDIGSALAIASDYSDKLSAINKFRFTGILKNSVIKYDPALESTERLYLDSAFSQLSGQFEDQPFRFAGISGHVQGTQGQGNLHITSNMAELVLEEIQPQSVALYELNTELNWKFQDNNLSVNTPLLEAHTQDFNLRLKGKLNFQQDKALPFVDMALELSNFEIDKFADYLPVNTPDNVKHWLKSALVAGTIPSADFIFRGWMDEYPFRNNEGIFQGYAVVNQGKLDYHPEWPPIDGINAGITVDADKLTIEASSGNIFDAGITKASAVIENLAAHDLQKSVLINGHIDGAIKDAMTFIHSSPLQNNPSLQDLSSKNITGGLGLDLALDIPLSNGLTEVDGKISLHDAMLDSGDIGIQLTELNGEIDFTQDSVSASGIKANYFEHPVHLAIESSDGSPVKSTLSGSADNQFITEQLLLHFPTLEHLKPEIEKRISGQCLWEASIMNTAANDDSKSEKQLVITSTLEGLAIDLPSPLSRSEKRTPLELIIHFSDKNRQQINVQYANILDGIIDVNDIGNEKIVTTSLAFGGDAAINKPDKQITITGNIDHLVVNEWLDLFPVKTDTATTKTEDKSVSLDLQIGSLEFLNQNFSDVSLKLNNMNAGYHLNINADSIRGNVYLDQSIDKNPIKIDLQKLFLITNEDKPENEKLEIIPEKIPPLDIKIAEFSYNKTYLGQISLATAQTKNGLSVDNIKFNKPGMTISGSGVWNMMNDQHHSKFKLALNATSMKNMLETFNYDVTAVEEAKTGLTLDAQWSGTPVDFSLNNLNGTLHMEIEKGRFTEIDSNAGRLFGLLSLQTLPRRLSLDFSDLFGKGLAFDSIEGHFSIENGNAYTNNLAMTGPSVNINISGRTGLVEQDYDQIATITPKFSDSLPVASALFGPVGVGVGAVIFLAGEIFQSLPDKIDTMLSKQYSIKGAWNDPHVTKINQNNDDNNNNG